MFDKINIYIELLTYMLNAGTLVLWYSGTLKTKSALFIVESTDTN